MQQRRYSIRVNRLPPGTAFTLDALVAHVNALAAALAAASCSIIIMTLPPIGEDLSSDVNARVGFACTVLRPEYATGDYKVCIGVQSGQPLACCTREWRLPAFMTLPLTGEQLGGAMCARVGLSCQTCLGRQRVLCRRWSDYS